MQSRHQIAIAAVAIILLLLPSLADAALDTGVNQTGNHTAFNVTSNSFTEVVGANLSLTSTATGTYYSMFIAEVRTNWTGAQGQARVVMDGTTLGTYNLTSLSYFTTSPLFFAVPVNAGNHYLTVQMAVENYSSKQRIMYVSKWNMTVGFLRNFDVNSSAQVGIPQVTNLQGTLNAMNSTASVNDTNINSTIAELRVNDTSINSTITELRINDTNINSTIIELRVNDTIINSSVLALRNNDTYFNSTEFAGSQTFRNDSINQGVRTTDSPTFTGVNSSYYNTSDGRELQNGGCDASYCIKYSLTDGTTVEAVNGTDGSKISGADAATVVNTTIFNAPTNSKIVIQSPLTFNTPIFINKTIDFEAYNTITATGDAIIIGNASARVDYANIKLRKLVGSANTTGTGITLNGFAYGSITFNDIETFQKGIYFDAAGSGTGRGAFESRLYGGQVKNTTYGILFSNSTTVMEGNVIFATLFGNRVGIQWNASGDSKYTTFFGVSDNVGAGSGSMDLIDDVGSNHIFSYFLRDENSTYNASSYVMNPRNAPGRLFVGLRTDGNEGVEMKNSGQLEIWDTDGTPLIDLKTSYSTDADVRLVKTTGHGLQLVTNKAGTPQTFTFGGDGSMNLPNIGAICKYANNTLYAC